MALDKSLNNLAQSSPRVTPSKRSQVRIGLAGGGRRIRTFGSWSRDRQNVMEDGTAVSERERICWGTKGSNPSPSSGKSVANLTSGAVEGKLGHLHPRNIDPQLADQLSAT